MLAASILENGGVLAGNNTIKFDTDKSITKRKIGDEIDLDEPTFAKLSSAFFVEITAKYVK
jgi:hypothetical protein